MHPETLRVTTLHIGPQQTLVTGRAGEPHATLILPVGFRNLGGAGFRHAPPTPIELENAIALVEDELFRIRDAVVKESALVTADAAVRAIAQAAGAAAQGETALTRDAVEQVFNRLAAIVQGRPASQDVIPVDADFAATLLILREFMHHLEFASITVK